MSNRDDETPRADAGEELAHYKARVGLLEQEITELESELTATQHVKRLEPRPTAPRRKSGFDGAKFGREIVTLVKAYVEPVRAQHAELVKRLEELETRAVGGVRYEGVYENGRTYIRGSFVSSRGSVWHADRQTSARPGDPDSGWTLAVKRGRDGRSARGSAGGHDDA